MSNKAEITRVIEELRAASATISAVADWLCPNAAGSNASSKPKPALKLTDVRPVLADLSRAGHTAEIKALLLKYGADRLSGINPADYEALLRDAEAIGNGS